MFKLFKKKKEDKEEIELPPPPKPPEAAGLPEDEIMPGEEAPKLPEFGAGFPEMPEPSEEFPEFDEMPPKAAPSFEEEEQEIEHIEIPRLPEIEAHPSMRKAELEIPDVTPKKVFDRTIEEVAPSREEVIPDREIKPMFVAVDEYNTLTSNTNFVRSKLIEAEEYLQRLTDLKNQEVKAFDKWRKTLENVEAKLSYIDKVIAKAQG
jgi:hypothetical protein